MSELTKYKATISFTFVDEKNPENEKPGSCDVKEELFNNFFKLAFKNCDLESYTKIICIMILFLQQKCLMC